MEIKKVFLQNIRSYTQAEIEFPKGSVLLSGDIGSGKSTILLGVEFALFGLQRGALSGPSLLRNGTDYGKVRLEFGIDGKDIVVERTLRRGKKSVGQDSGFISIEGEKKELSSEEMRSLIIKLLEYPAEFLKKNPVLYRYTVYTPQEEMKYILLEKAEERLNTLRRIFAIDRYKRITENIEIFLTKLREEAKNKEGMIADLAKRKEESETKNKEANEIRKSIEKILPLLMNAAKLVKEKKAKVDEIESKLKQLNMLKTASAALEERTKAAERRNAQIERNVIDLNEEIKRISTELKEARDAIKEKEVKAENIAALIESLQKTIREKKQGLKQLENSHIQAEKKVTQLETKKEEIEKLREDIRKLSICPKCKQKITPEYKQQVLFETEVILKDYTTKLESSIKEKEEAEKKLPKVEEELSSLEKKQRVIEIARISLKNIEDKEKVKKSLIEEQKTLREEITREKKRHAELEREIKTMAGIEEIYAKEKAALEEVREKETSIKIKRAEEEKHLESIIEVIRNLQHEIKEKEAIKMQLQHFNKIKSWLIEHFNPLIAIIERNVMVTLHAEFNSYFEKWFNMLVAGELSARLDENFTPVVEQAGYEIDYEFLSGGERTAAALAYRLALNQVINSLLSHIKTRDLLILDEPTDGFSSEQLDKMKDVLQEINAKQLILVSHEAKIEDFVSNVIRFSKQDHISRIG